MLSDVANAPVGLYVYPVTGAVVPSEYVAVTTMPALSKLSPSVYVVRDGGVVTSIFDNAASTVSFFVRLM